MEKLVGPPALRDVLDLRVPVEATVRAASDALLRPVRVVVLDKPRHGRLIARLHAAGAVVSTPPDGDVAGALAALLPGTGSDLLMGIGGTPEGVITACAVRALGGFMQARLAPQRDDERRALLRAALDAERVYELDELAGEGLFAATAVTDGPLLRRRESLVIRAGEVRRVPAR
jgi:fructose-1,6-bisphosphatase II